MVNSSLTRFADVDRSLHLLWIWIEE